MHVVIPWMPLSAVYFMTLSLNQNSPVLMSKSDWILEWWQFNGLFPHKYTIQSAQQENPEY